MLLNIATAGYAVLAIGVLLGTLGAPLPLGIALATTGALARQGHLNILLVFLCSVGAAVLGDNLGYVVGRYVLRRLPFPVGTFKGPKGSRRFMVWVTQQGHLGLVIFLTRWSLTAPATLVNLVAGYRRYRWRTFAIIDLAGEALWVALALAPGYLLGASWNGDLGVAVALILLFSLLCSWLFQRWLTRHTSATLEAPSLTRDIPCHQAA